MHIPENIKAGLLEALRSSGQSGTPSSDPALLFRKRSNAKPIGKHRNYFITKSGSVFTIREGKEIGIPAHFRGYRKLMVRINGDEKELIYLMLEAFDIKYTPNDRIDYSISAEGGIPLSGIKIIPFTSKYDPVIHTKEEKRMYEYCCDRKAASSNSRCSGIITPIEVFTCLKVHHFNCFYCGCGLNPKKWHLDHYIAIAKGGLNTFNNIVPACPMCNTMKSDFGPTRFMQQCQKIVTNFKEKQE